MNYIKFQVHQIKLETKLGTDNVQISNFIKSSESHEKENRDKGSIIKRNISISNKNIWFISVAVKIGVGDRRTEKVVILKFSTSTLYTKTQYKSSFPFLDNLVPRAFWDSL